MLKKIVNWLAENSVPASHDIKLDQKTPWTQQNSSHAVQINSIQSNVLTGNVLEKRVIFILLIFRSISKKHPIALNCKTFVEINFFRKWIQIFARLRKIVYPCSPNPCCSYVRTRCRDFAITSRSFRIKMWKNDEN